jgi:hypothetical protein
MKKVNPNSIYIEVLKEELTVTKSKIKALKEYALNTNLPYIEKNSFLKRANILNEYARCLNEAISLYNDFIEVKK